MHAIEITETGGPEVLRYVETAQPTPGQGEVLIKTEAIGVNFIDTYFRSGQYPEQCRSFSAGGVRHRRRRRRGADGLGGRPGGHCHGDGGYAEFVTAPASFIA